VDNVSCARSFSSDCRFPSGDFLNHRRQVIDGGGASAADIEHSLEPSRTCGENVGLNNVLNVDEIARLVSIAVDDRNENSASVIHGAAREHLGCQNENIGPAIARSWS
jgi:hypothetical protein